MPGARESTCDHSVFSAGSTSRAWRAGQPVDRAHTLGDVLDALQQRRHAEERLGAAHLRQRFELEARLERARALDAAVEHGPDVADVVAALLEQVRQADPT